MIGTTWPHKLGLEIWVTPDAIYPIELFNTHQAVNSLLAASYPVRYGWANWHEHVIFRRDTSCTEISPSSSESTIIIPTNTMKPASITQVSFNGPKVCPRLSNARSPFFLFHISRNNICFNGNNEEIHKLKRLVDAKATSSSICRSSHSKKFVI